MRLSETDALERLHGHDHGVLGTLHAERGVDLTPTVYAAADGFLGSPVDLVKAKSSLRLQRERNLESDPRATLLVEQWDRADWSELWWVRAELRWVGEDRARADVLASRLAEAFPQYRDKPFASVLVFEIVRATGWSATGSTGADR
ncbi:MAG TPA: pyridoxamine 5'-phosphate oxidase family protein [Acidimicrobiales bacterium]|nr:pyridoxamine 5'-phosphate oxidase family protein [Acidimicrobiales bacterium]